MCHAHGGGFFPGVAGYHCPGIIGTLAVENDGIGHRGGAFFPGGGGAFCDEAPRDDAGAPVPMLWPLATNP